MTEQESTHAQTSDRQRADAGSDEPKPDLRNALYVPSHASSIDLTDVLDEAFWDKFATAGIELAKRAEEERAARDSNQDESAVSQLRDRFSGAVQSFTERFRTDPREEKEPVDKLEEALDALEPRVDSGRHRDGSQSDKSPDRLRDEPQSATDDDE